MSVVGVLIIVVYLGCVFILCICCVLGFFLLFKMLLGMFNVVSFWKVFGLLILFLLLLLFWYAC